MFKKIIIFGGLLFLAVFILTEYTNINPKDMLASIFFVDNTTVSKLKSKHYVRILIVPGHDDEYRGTEYKGIKEADLNVELAEHLTNYLRQEERFQVYLLRNKAGYDSGYLGYLETYKNEIFAFQKKQKEIMSSLTSFGLIDSYMGSEAYNNALPEIANRLHGINKWSNDLSMDIIIHVHFNDYAGRYSDWTGKYSGLTVYIPDKQYSNSKVSRSIAESISKSLGKYFAYSDLPYEEDEEGIKETQELIALGVANTLDASSLLIEYGYIYEPQFTNSNTKEIILQEMAMQTYLGVLDFFDEDSIKTTATLPYRWNFDLKKGMKNNKDIFALQTFLVGEGFYPPFGSNLTNCPMSGGFGNCTLQAVKTFQEEYNIVPAFGFVGSLTRNKLNEFK